MREFIFKIKDSVFVNGIKSFLSSEFFPFITAAVTLICYYLSLDIVIIAYIGITGALIFLLLDDVSPIFTVFLFMGVMLSIKNSPSTIRGHSDYFYRPEIFVPIIIIITLLVAAMVFRFVKTCMAKKFKLTPVFFGLCAFSVALLLNGANQKDYDIKNLMFAGMMAAFFLWIFAVVKDNLELNKKTYEKIALSFFALSILLLVELAVIYAVNDKVVTDGRIDRVQIIWGWGKYNYFGVLITMCIPAVTYLAGVKKFGFLYTLYSILIIVACFLSYSRQTMVCSVAIYACCLAVLIWKGKYKIQNAVITTLVVIAILVLFLTHYSEAVSAVKRIFHDFLTDGETYGYGRMNLWRTAIANFKASPVFGVGFYQDLPGDIKKGFSFIPSMYHNTILQMMGACGILGLVTYLVHRVQTVISYFKNITVERTFIAFIILVILITSLVDHHIFNIFPTIVYSCLVAVLVKSENKEKKENNKIPQENPQEPNTIQAAE